MLHESMSAGRNKPKLHAHAMLRAIAVFKFAKAALMFLIALGAQALISPEVNQWARDTAGDLQIRTHSHYVRLLLGKFGALEPQSFEAISLVAFFYTALLSAEGIGLWLEKRWAEYLTIIITVSLVPAELYEIWRHATLTRFVILAANVAIVAYLVAVLRRGRTAATSPQR
jgi:uncharacterized membrane protein (DUF2068 family)